MQVCWDQAGILLSLTVGPSNPYACKAGIAIQQLSNVGAHVHPLQSTLEALWVNAYGKGCNPGQGAVVLNTLWCTLHAPTRQ